MMKRLLPCLMALLSFSMLSAQICSPDPQYMDSTGVFPMPYHPDVNPTGGINECAYVGEPFEFVFTVGVGDSISLTIGSTEFRFPLDKVQVTEVQNLPTGIQYACVPSDCVFPKNSLGCAKIYGTPTTAGDYQLTIKARVFFAPPTFPPFFDASFPDATIAPGEYKLTVLPDQNTACNAVATRESLASKMGISANPNPTSGWLNLDISSEIQGDFTFQILDLTGQTAHQEKVAILKGSNRLAFDGSHLPNGIYLAKLQSGLGVLTKKFTIQH